MNKITRKKTLRFIRDNLLSGIRRRDNDHDIIIQDGSKLSRKTIESIDLCTSQLSFPAVHT